MKILEDYKKIAQELLFEVDDEKMIKYKDEDGESKEMKAGSAKTMPDEHPAKQAYNNMKDDGGDDKEEPSGQKLGGSDFDRDSGDAPPEAWDVEDEFGGEDSEVAKYLKSLQGKEDDEDDEGDIDIAKGKDYGGRGFGDDDDLDDDPSSKANMEKEFDIEIPDGFFVSKITPDMNDPENAIVKKSDFTKDEVAMKIADSMAKKLGVSSEDALEKAKEEYGYADSYKDFAAAMREELEFMSESVEPKKKPFLKEQLERFGGLK